MKKGIPDNPNASIWTTPEWSFDLLYFHPGSRFSMRTVKGATGSPQGNQCTYTKNGRLISLIPSAGSADYYGPNNNQALHYSHDVETFFKAEKLNRIRDYYSVRPRW